MKSFDRTVHCALQWTVGAALTATAAVSGMGAAAADTPTDVLGPITDAAATAPLAASLSNEYFPASIPYSADPANPFSPVYTIEPVGAPEVSVTTASGEVDGTQAFSVDTLGIPVGTFTGQFDYSPISSPAFIFGNPYGDFILATDTTGTPVPEGTGFLLDEFGFGFGNVFESSENVANTAYTVGDFLLTPYGDINISPIVEALMNFTGTL